MTTWIAICNVIYVIMLSEKGELMGITHFNGTYGYTNYLGINDEYFSAAPFEIFLNHIQILPWKYILKRYLC